MALRKATIKVLQKAAFIPNCIVRMTSNGSYQVYREAKKPFLTDFLQREMERCLFNPTGLRTKVSRPGRRPRPSTFESAPPTAEVLVQMLAQTIDKLEAEKKTSKAQKATGSSKATKSVRKTKATADKTVLVKSSLPANALPAASVCITSASGTDISMTSSTDNTQPHGDGWGSEDESESSPTDKVALDNSSPPADAAPASLASTAPTPCTAISTTMVAPPTATVDMTSSTSTKETPTTSANETDAAPATTCRPADAAPATKADISLTPTGANHEMPIADDTHSYGDEGWGSEDESEGSHADTVSADTPKAGDSIPAVWPSDHPNTYPTPLQTVSTSLADPLAVAPSDEVVMPGNQSLVPLAPQPPAGLVNPRPQLHWSPIPPHPRPIAQVFYLVSGPPPQPIGNVISQAPATTWAHPMPTQRVPTRRHIEPCPYVTFEEPQVGPEIVPIEDEAVQTCVRAPCQSGWCQSAAQDDDCGWELDLAKACKWSKDDCCPSKPRKHKGLWSKLKSGAKSLFTKDEPAPYWQADRLPLKIYRSAAPEQAPAAPARKKEDKGALAKAKAFFTCSAFL